MSQDNPNGQTQYLIDGELVADTLLGTANRVLNALKPVAAQEPIFWACYAKDKLVEVTNNTEYVHTFKCNFPLTHRIVPLYDHAVPCARCAELGKTVIEQGGNISKLEATIIQCGVEASELQAKITEQAEELRIIRANLAQLEKDFDRRNEVVDAQVERIKALEPKS